MNRKGEMTKNHIRCYRTNYSKGWDKYARDGWIELPAGVLDAVEYLCREVERLNGWKQGKEIEPKKGNGK